MAWSLRPVIENLRWGHILTEEQIKICYEDNFYSDPSVYTCVHGSSAITLYFTLNLHSCDFRFTITIVLLQLAIFF